MRERNQASSTISCQEQGNLTDELFAIFKKQREKESKEKMIYH